MSGDHDKYHGTAEVLKREWVGLTDEDIGELALMVFKGFHHHVEPALLADLIRVIEANLKEKNT